jgi:ATPase subunit of ABC transporter with duplicated ATPase domains
MLSVKNLIIKNIQQDLILVDNLSFTINEYEKIAIIGSEGSGKSTLLKVIAGIEVSYIAYECEIIKPQVISYLEQNIDEHWGDFSVHQYLEDQIIKSGRYEYYGNSLKIIGNLGLIYDEIRDRKIKTFSGGEKVKIGLVKALMNEPDLLLLDEPTNDLDFSTLLFLEDFLNDLETPVLFVSHDQRLLQNVSNGIIHLQHVHKKTKAKTSFLKVDYTYFMEQQKSKYLSNLMIARKQRSDYKKKIERFTQIYQKVEYQQNQAVREPTKGRLLKKKMKSLKSQEERFVKEKDSFMEIPENEESMNLFFNNNHKINPHKQILDLDINNFELKDGQIIKNIKLSILGTDKIVIVGNNGIGKTTLIQHISKVFKAKGIKYGYVSQNYLEVLDGNMNPIDFLISKKIKFDETRIRQIFGNMGFKKEEMVYPIRSLSDGTKLKIILTLLVGLDTQVLLLDEPTRNLSPLNQNELYDLFLNFSGAIIAISHDREFIESVFDDIYELSSDGLKKLDLK